MQLKKSRLWWLNITITITITIIITTTTTTIIIIITTITIIITTREVREEAVLHVNQAGCRLLGSELATLIWVSLADRCFAAKALLLSYWISLDFLGFSRPN